VTRARVYIYIYTHNISLLTSVKEVTRFIAMLDFYLHCYIAFAATLSRYIFTKRIREWFPHFFAHANTALGMISSRYDISQADGSFSASFVFKTRYDEFIFNAVKYLLKLYADQPICYYLSVRAICTSIFQTFFCVLIWPL